MSVRRVQPVAYPEVEPVIELIPNPVPTSGEIRIARAWLAEVVNAGLDPIRTPVLVGLGAADLAVDAFAARLDRGLATARRLSERLTGLGERLIGLGERLTGRSERLAAGSRPACEAAGV